MNKHIGKIIGLLILTLLVTGCTVFVRVNRPNTYLEGWVYKSNDYSTIIVSGSNQVPRGYSPLEYRDVIINGDGYSTTKRTNEEGYFRTGTIPTGRVEILIDSGPSVERFITYIYLGRNTLGSPTVARGHYIFVGIDEYPNIQNYKNRNVSRRDAEQMEQVLIAENAMIGTSQQLINSRATKNNIKQAIKAASTAANQSSADDYLVFYFSGYADEEIYKGLEGYANALDHLVPYDGNNSGTSTEVRKSVITDGELADWLKEFPNDNITVILDVAHSETFIDGTPRTQRVEPLALLEPGYTVLTATQSDKRNVVRENDISLFTMLLIEGIRESKADQNRNGIITAGELYDYADNEMRKLNPTIFDNIKDYVFPSMSGSRSTVIFKNN